MSKISNVLTMLLYLSNGNKKSIQELAHLLEVSPRMIRVYKEELEKAGIYIETIKGPNGGYVFHQKILIPEQFDLKDMKTTEKEMFQLLNQAIKEKRKCFILYEAKDNQSVSERIIRPYELCTFKDDLGVVAYCEWKQEMRCFYFKRIKNIEILDFF